MGGKRSFFGVWGMGVREGSLGELVERVAPGGEPLLDALDHLALSELSGGRPDRLLAPFIDDVLRLSLRNHPWSQLLAAAALWDIRRGDPRIEHLVASASRAFADRDDRTGLGFVAHVRGNFALGRGDLAAAARRWEEALAALGEDAPCSELNLAFLSLDAYRKGELRTAIKLAEQSLALARLRDHQLAEGTALVFVAVSRLTAGDFAKAEACLALAERAWDDLAEPDEPRDLPLLYGARGALLALRRRDTEAREAFDEAIESSVRLGNTWHGAMARAAAAEFLAHHDGHRARADAREAHATFVELGDKWFKVWAIRAEGVAARACGDLDDSAAILAGLLSSPLDPIERARTQLALAETFLELHRPVDACAYLKEAAAASQRLGLRYWHTRSAVLLATVDPRRRDQWHRVAQALRTDDPAYDSIFGHGTRLRISVLGQSGVTIDGAPVRFLTQRAQLLVFALAIAGPAGLHIEEAVERLWPETSPDVGRHGLRTALWEARRALGGEAWRLIRNRDHLRLDLAGADFDLAGLGSVSEGDPPTHTDDTLLPAWRHLDWVRREQERIREAVRRREAADHSADGGPA